VLLTDTGDDRMKTFLAIYLGSAASAQRSSWDQLDEPTRNARQAAGMKAWGEWMVAHKDAVVASGGPLGKTKRASRDGIADTKNNLTGYVIVQAETHEAAARMFENHPHFTIFPGDSVEIVECLPMPGR
jgi:transcription antitermination factor NusG